MKTKYKRNKVNIWQWATLSKEIVPCEACGVKDQLRHMHSIWDGKPPEFYSVHYCDPCWSALVSG